MHVRTGRVSARAFESHGLALCDRLADLDQRRGEVAVKGVQASRVCDDDVISITAARAADQGHHTVVGRIYRRAERLHQVDARVAMGALAASGLEPERAGAEALWDLRLPLPPAQAASCPLSPPCRHPPPLSYVP